MSYDVGQTVRLPIEVRNDAGALTDATVTVAVARPDSTPFPGLVVSHPSTGLYYADVKPDGTNYGIWTWQFNVGGAVADSVYTGQFFVRSPGPRLVSLVEVKNHLNKQATITTDDAELRDWIDAAQVVIEGIVGPVLRRTCIETHSGWAGRRSRIVLRQGPVLTVTSVVEDWGGGDVRTLTAEPASPGPYGDDEYLLDASVRTIKRRSGGYPTVFGSDVTVTYVAGQAVPAQNVRLATMELITHMWRGSQLATGSTRPRADAPDPISLAYAVPNRVREMLGRRRGPRLGV